MIASTQKSKVLRKYICFFALVLLFGSLDGSSMIVFAQDHKDAMENTPKDWPSIAAEDVNTAYRLYIENHPGVYNESDPLFKKHSEAARSRGFELAALVRDEAGLAATLDAFRVEPLPDGASKVAVPIKLYRARRRAPGQIYHPAIQVNDISWSTKTFESVIEADLHYQERSSTARQIIPEHYLSGSDTPEQSSKVATHLFGDWSGARTRLEQRGLSFNLLYVSDSLANVRSVQPGRFTSFSRVRGTIDLDLARLAQVSGLTVHMTGVWQTGANLMNYLDTLASPSALATANAFRLDSWWFQKTFQKGRVAFRAGQFSGLDSYGSQYLGSTFFSQPMSYGLTALGNTYETYQPFATSAAEMRVVPFEHLYLKSMVQAGDRLLTDHNLTGFVPQFLGAPVSISEIGWSPGMRASEIKQASTVDTRQGYSGLYQFGAAFNPGKFMSLASAQTLSGDYTLYGIASQALYRLPGKPGTGPDITVGVSSGPADRNKNDGQLTVGLRYDELFPLKKHNTLAVAWVHSALSPYARRQNPQMHKCSGRPCRT